VIYLGHLLCLVKAITLVCISYIWYSFLSLELALFFTSYSTVDPYSCLFHIEHTLDMK
jgi:hypothetical protein